MPIALYPVTPSFAAEIGDVDLSGQLDPADLLAIKEAFAKYAVLIFPDQHLSQDQHLDFARHFGPLETSIAVHRKDTLLRLREEFTDVSNLDFTNQIWGRKAGDDCSSSALGCGIPTTRSNGYRRARHCSMRARSRRSAAIQSLLTSGQPMMRFPRR